MTSQQMLPSIRLVLIRQESLTSGSHSYVRQPVGIYVAEKIIYVGSRVGLLGITWDEASQWTLWPSLPPW